ncbi:hypothetical protein ACFZDG_29835 [Kitasatospora xanthocidica]
MRPSTSATRADLALRLLGQAVRGAFTGASRSVTDWLIKFLSE